MTQATDPIKELQLKLLANICYLKLRENFKANINSTARFQGVMGIYQRDLALFKSSYAPNVGDLHLAVLLRIADPEEATKTWSLEQMLHYDRFTNLGVLDAERIYYDFITKWNKLPK